MKIINNKQTIILLTITLIITMGMYGLIQAQVLTTQEIQKTVETSFFSKQNIKLSSQPDLNEYRKILLENDPAIKSAFAGWKATQKKITAEKGLPDPQISFGYFIHNIETAVGPQEYRLGIRQPIPWPGKLVTRSHIQRLQAQASFQYLQEVINKKLLQLYEVYYKNYYLKKAITITLQNITLIESWEKVILTRYKSNIASYTDLMKTQMELLKLQDELETLQNKQKPYLETFRWLLNIDINYISTPDSLIFTPLTRSKEEAIQLMLNNNPRLRSLVLSTRIMNKKIKLNKLNFLPDFSLGVDYIATGNKYNLAGEPVPESGKDPLMIMGSVSIPLWFFKQSSKIQSARLEKIESDFTYEDQQNNLRNQFESIWFQIEETGRKIKLYREKLLPKAMESLRASEKAYISGDTEFLNLIDFQQMYLRYRLSAQKALSDYYIALANLDLITGGTLWEK